MQSSGWKLMQKWGAHFCYVWKKKHEPLHERGYGSIPCKLCENIRSRCNQRQKCNEHDLLKVYNMWGTIFFFLPRDLSVNL